MKYQLFCRYKVCGSLMFYRVELRTEYQCPDTCPETLLLPSHHTTTTTILNTTRSHIIRIRPGCRELFGCYGEVAKLHNKYPMILVVIPKRNQHIHGKNNANILNVSFVENEYIKVINNCSRKACYSA